MADINLLQGSEVFEAGKKSNLRFFKWLGYAILLLSVLAYVGLFFLNSSVQKKIVANETKQQEVQNEIIEQTGYKTFIASQNKLKDAKLLLDQHYVWSDFIAKFSAATLKTATYSKFTANADGSLNVTGVVPDFQSLDKLYKAYLLPEFSDYINDVKLVSVSLGGSDAENKSGVNFTIKITFNAKLLRPELPNQTLSQEAE